MVLRSVHDAKDKHSVHCLEDNTCCVASGMPQEFGFSALDEVTYEVAFHEMFDSFLCTVYCAHVLFFHHLCIPSPKFMYVILDACVRLCVKEHMDMYHMCSRVYGAQKRQQIPWN